MKIQRFEQINERMSAEIKEYITNMDDNCDGVIEWIMLISIDSKVPEYTNIYNKKFQEAKKIINVQKTMDAEKEMIRLSKEINKIEREMENIKLELANELMYKFQEDLLKKDPEKLYELFLSDDEYDNEYGEIHPNIVKKYRSDIESLISAKKYNL
jgi:valyl-tRNA synthetase